MAKLAEKIEVASILYTYGYSVKEIIEIVGMATPKQLISHIRKNKIEQKYPERQPLNLIIPDDLDKIVEHGFDKIIKEKYFIENDVEEEPNIKFFDNVNEMEISKINLELSEELSPLEKYQKEVERYKRLINVQDIDNICSVCQNKGVVSLPKRDGTLGVQIVTCPKCKGESIHYKKTSQKIKLSEETLLEFIPNYKYRSFDFDKDTLLKTIDLPEDIKSKHIVDTYANDLELRLLDFKNGKLPKRTEMITAPDGFGKKFFVYQAIKESLLYGYSPTPLISMLEISDKFVNYKHNELIELYDNDIIFIEIDSTVIFPDVYKFILSNADKKGIPIIFISRFEQASIIQQKFKDNYNPDWYDIFRNQTFDYDFGYIVPNGIYGNVARDIYQYKRSSISDFLLNSPILLKVNSFANNQENEKDSNDLKDAKNLLTDIGLNKHDKIIKADKSALEKESGIDI